MAPRKNKQTESKSDNTLPALQGNEGGERRPFNPLENVNPKGLVRIGLSVMKNEMERLVEKSIETGLNGVQAGMLKEFVKCASDIAKKHRDLNIGFMTPEELESLTDEEMGEYLRTALKDFPIQPVNRKKIVPAEFTNMDENEN